ncbi:hypothetical protein LEP3755_15670 [Leptolyngbya sp. NIES-3755]|nr:hypothetical protein LEP3755_15670 [Leptolyngbya sp. NIES-3755]
MVNFNFSYAPGTTLQQMIGFEMAGRVWSSYLSDPVTINIHVGVSSSLPGNAIGGALPGIESAQNYRSVVRGLEDDVTSLDDQTALPNLQDKSDYEAWFDEFDRKKGNNKGEKVKTKSINITRANAKALDLVSAPNELDGVILFGGLQGSNFRWSYDFTRSSPTTANTLDFLSTAMHEIAHILGFVSGVDKPGWLNSLAVDKDGSEQYKKSLSQRVSYTTPLDLFRYSTTAGEGVNDLSYGSVGGEKFFSIDGGETAIAHFSTGSDRTLGGDGFQASHWKNGATRTGIMAPALSPEERSTISITDLRAFDVIGWDLRPGAYGLNLNLSALQSQAEVALAQRLRVSVSWLSQNTTAAEQLLVSDRANDIDRMIQRSQIYPWGTRSGGGTTPWRQVLDLLEQQVVYSNFETLDEEFQLFSETQSTVQMPVFVEFPAAIPPQFQPVQFSLDLSLMASKVSEIPQTASIAIADFRNWFDYLEKSIRRSPQSSRNTPKQNGQRSRKFTDSQEIVHWTDL